MKGILLFKYKDGYFLMVDSNKDYLYDKYYNLVDSGDYIYYYNNGDYEKHQGNNKFLYKKQANKIYEKEYIKDKNENKY